MSQLFSGASLTITQKVAQESAGGSLDLTRPAVNSAIPTPTKDITSMHTTLTALKSTVDQLAGNSGSVLDKGLTVRDLVAEGAMSLKIGKNIYTGTNASALDNGSGYQDPRPVFLIPPAPTNLTAQGAFKNVVLNWDFPQMANLAYLEIFRSGTNARGTAIRIGTSYANLYSDANVVTGSTYYYWVRGVAIGGQYGPDNAVSGTSAGLLVIGSTDLGPLVVSAYNLSQGTYPNINLVPNPGAEDGLVCWFVGSGSTGTAVLAVDPTDKTGGTQSFKATKLLTSDIITVASQAFPVIPGETYSFKTRARGNVASAAGFYMRVIFRATTPLPTQTYIDASNYAGGSNYFDQVADGAITSTWAAYEGTFVVPAGMYWCSVNFGAYNTSTNTSLWFDDVSVGRQITASFLAAGSIAVGTAAIQNGAIVNAMIANLAVDTANIAAAAITNVKIANATITAAKIGSVDAATITVGLVTAGQIDSRSLSIKDASGNVLFASGTNLKNYYVDTPDPQNFVKTPSFEAGSLGDWAGLAGSSSVVSVTGQSWTKALSFTLRDSLAGSLVVVRPGETLFGSCDIDASAATSNMGWGVFEFNSAGGVTNFSQFGIGVVAGASWTHVNGSIVLANTTVQVIPWVQINGTSGAAGTGKGTNFYIGRTQAGANVSPLLTTLLNGNGNTTISGNTVTKTGGTNGTWGDASVYSKDGFTGGATCSFGAPVASTLARYMIGLNTDPLTDLSYGSIDYAWFINVSSGAADFYESGAGVGASIAFAAGDMFTVAYDNQFVRYAINGVVKRQVAVAPGIKFFLDSSFYDANASATAVQFSSLTSQAPTVGFLAPAPVTLIGNSARIASGTSGQVYSSNAYTGGAYVSVVIPANPDLGGSNQNPGIGLTLTPGVGTFASLNCAIHWSAGGPLYAVESGTFTVINGSFAVGDVLSVIYDGSNVRWYQNGVLRRTVGQSAGLKFYLGSVLNFYATGSTYGIDSIDFGPYGNPSAVSPTNTITSGNVSTYIAALAVGSIQLAAGAATDIYFDSFDYGGSIYHTSTIRTFTVTPNLNCDLEFSATITAAALDYDSAVSFQWQIVDPVGPVTTTLAHPASQLAPRTTYTALTTFTGAVGGRTYTFNVILNTAGVGNPHFYDSTTRITMVKK